MIKKVALFLIKLYQKSLSPLTFGSCRYYPSCSEYAKWQFENNSFFYAFFASMLRILRCNKFFSGGFEYPKTPLFRTKPIFGRRKIKYWLVPTKNKKFLVIKDLREKD